MMVDESQGHILVMVIPPSMTEILAMGSYKPLLLGRGVEAPSTGEPNGRLDSDPIVMIC